jgi:hypothetical protein
MCIYLLFKVDIIHNLITGTQISSRIFLLRIKIFILLLLLQLTSFISLGWARSETVQVPSLLVQEGELVIYGVTDWEKFDALSRYLESSKPNFVVSLTQVSPRSVHFGFKVLGDFGVILAKWHRDQKIVPFNGQAPKHSDLFLYQWIGQGGKGE